MDADDFWRKQREKNKNGAPKHTVSTDPETPEEAFMSRWIEKWSGHFSYFNNLGCGCCVNIYEFDAPEEAVAEIPVELVNPYEDRHR